MFDSCSEGLVIFFAVQRTLFDIALEAESAGVSSASGL